MSLPTLVKTYQYSVNNAQAAQGTALADNRLLLINIKNAMIGFASNAWAVDYSSTSTTAGTKGDGVDRWGSTGTNLVFAATGTAHSWMVLKQTGIASTYELLIDLNVAATGGQQLSIIISPAAGFTGGSTTTAPTATDSKALIAAATWGGVNTTDQAARWSVMQSTDGTITRIIICAAGAVTTIMGFEVALPSVSSGWANPCVSYAIASPATTTTPWCNGLNFAARIGTTTSACNLSCEGSVTGTLGPNDAATQNIANEVDGGWPMWPLGIWSTTVGVRGRVGNMQDLWLGSLSVASGDSYPASGTTGQFAQFGILIVPWNTGAVNLT